MTEHEAQDLKARALEAINEIRAQYGRDVLTEIPVGRVWSSRACPVRWALADCGVSDVGPRTYLIGGRDVGLPLILMEFIDRFDSREYPELELR